MYNVRSQFLTAYPEEGMATSCTSSRWTLGSAQQYGWAAFYYSYAAEVTLEPQFKSIYLGAGSYTWTDCLKPMHGYYIHTSTLDPDNPAWQTATVSRIFYLNGWAPTGDAGWGSSLHSKS
ncbi:hypothetical protein OG555_24505 [Kribbella sp. NBC_01484]|uniref:hypothetical protein n=1 Tax=Kribbella sp. NBC_01484 TaxID=2903579 RepID=UPI002E3785B6|nr:hypothetical protein [Kribbella sp. NBC_01484]